MHVVSSGRDLVQRKTCKEQVGKTNAMGDALAKNDTFTGWSML